MSRVSKGMLICAAAALCAAASPLLARQQQQQQQQSAPNQPGMPTIARMYILNEGASQAVPVTIHNSGDVLPVAVMSTPAVPVARQAWEYRQVEVEEGADVAAALESAGLQGWEAVAVTPAGKTRQVLMKRPR
jgi:hypothetical protein